MNFRFRNSGVGGDTIPKVLARFDYDVAAWKPTVVSVELGMNDKGGFTTEQFIANMAKLTEKIQSAKARPVFLTASPVNNGEMTGKLGQNARLDEYAVALKKFSEEQKAPFADQFHQLIDVWGKNKARENVANAIAALKAVEKDDSIEGVEHLRAFLAAQEKSKAQFVSMKGDAVHPGEPGQLMMATALLKDLGAPGFVSSVGISVNGVKQAKDAKDAVAAKGCEVSGVKFADGKLTFDRLDACLPIPIADGARPVVEMFPAILELSQYTLKVSDLPEEKYTLTINGTEVATVTAKDLARGVNLTAYPKGPLADQGKAILAAVDAKEKLVGEWRGQSKAANGDAEKLTDQTKKVEEADAKIREAAKPKTLRCELAPAK
jgi:lysophospholipase L1-like esterase